jgi:AmmeMemoRadiSam system protein B
MKGMRVRRPAVAGTFYAAEPDELERQLDASFADARGHGDSDTAPPPKAIVVPHAGYIYSGPIAATGYRRLAAARDSITTVVLLGPSHRVPLRGLALPDVDALATPLGVVPIDAAGRDIVLQLPQVSVADAPHAVEHSLEVHLPFLQRALREFSVVPLVVGRASAEEIAEVVDAVWGGDETLIVVSTDLSHYHDHATAVKLDRATADAVEAGDPDRIDDMDACGAYPLRGLLVAAARRGLAARTVDLRTSGDTAGDRERVVGYGAFVLH